MRIPFAALAAVTLAACAPSASEIRTAHEAHYKGTPPALVAAAETAVVDQQYQVAQENVAEGTFVTQAKWYAKEGDVRTPDMTGAKVEDGAIRLAMVVTFHYHPDLGYSTVEITPLMDRLVEGHGMYDKVQPDDPSAPAWAHGKVDGLYVAINQALADQVIPAVPLAH
jgi:hypothetical protein